ncbi:hypothetical protein LNT82_06205 [Klebsiella pneumoniae]|nr:hypothetical protein [Klebsiella pneumoniae]
MKELSLLVPLVFTAPVQASEVTVGQICKAASAAMFGRDHKIMQLEFEHKIIEKMMSKWRFEKGKPGIAKRVVVMSQPKSTGGPANKQ